MNRSITRKSICIIVIMIVAFIIVGCGASETSDIEEPVFDEELQEDDYEQADEFDPYIDGISLEEAKEGDYGTIFIKDNLLYYPLIPSYDSGYISGVTKEEENAKDANYSDDEKNMKWYKVGEDYAQYDLPVLTESLKLVEVQSEYEGFFSTIIGKPVYSLPCTVSYRMSENVIDVEYDTEGNLVKKPEWTIRTDDSDSYILSRINDKEVGDKRLDDLALNIPKTSSSSLDEEGAIKHFQAFDWNPLNKKYGLKPIRVDVDALFDDLSVDFLFVKNLNESVRLNYREDRDVDSNDETFDANIAVYNMPEDIKTYVKPILYKYEYEQTDEGYSIIKTDKLPSGTYATNNGYIFRKQ